LCKTKIVLRTEVTFSHNSVKSFQTHGITIEWIPCRRCMWQLNKSDLTGSSEIGGITEASNSA